MAVYQQIPNATTDEEIQSVQFGALTISIYYADLLDEQAVEFFHAHRNTIEFYYALENSLEICLVDGQLPAQKLRTHDFLLINAGVGHNVQYLPNAPTKYFVINFSISETRKLGGSQDSQADGDVTFFSRAMEIMGEHPYLLRHDENREIESLIRRIINYSVSRRPNWKLLRRTLYVQLIVMLLSSDEDGLPEEPVMERNLAIAVTQYMHANYQNPDLDLQHLSKEFNFSMRQLSRLFEEYFSRTISKTLTYYRINYAKNYLLNTDWTVERIAEEVGFCSVSSLSRCFKEIENMTIGEFRKRNRHTAEHMHNFSHIE